MPPFVRTNSWAILTGEYPPAAGGVSDYTYLLSRELARQGQKMHVFAPPPPLDSSADAGASVHRLASHFGLPSLPELSRQIDRLGDCMLLVQYVPHAFGWRAMNLPLCLWLYSRRNRNRIVTMFHEVAFPFRWRQPLRHNVIALVNRVMAALVGAASERVLVSIPAWGRMLEELGVEREKIEVAPIFSNLPRVADQGLVREVRERYGRGGIVIGHFGTYGNLIAAMLRRVLPRILEDSSRRALLLGRGSEEFAGAMWKQHPRIADRITAAGELDAQQAAAHIAACDAMLQPYPDGLSGRRGTLLAALGLGVPVITNLGHLSEDFWRASGAVALAPSPQPDGITRVANETLSDSSMLQALSCRGRALYDERFDIRHTVDALIASENPGK